MFINFYALKSCGRDRFIFCCIKFCGMNAVLTKLKSISAHSKCTSRQKVRSVPLQLPAHLQELFPENRLPQAQLQVDHQPCAEPGHPARAHSAETLSL
jgi:hypothetical protein